METLLNIQPNQQNLSLHHLPATQSSGMPLVDTVFMMLNKTTRNLITTLSANTNRICIQHILNTDLPVFKSLTRLKDTPANQIYVGGKCYSTYTQAFETLTEMGVFIQPDELPQFPGSYLQAMQREIDTLWEHFIRNTNPRNDIIILDEGGRLIETIPDELEIHTNMVAIEQTQSGFNSQIVLNKNIPIIAAATSAVKKLIEAPLISQAIAIRLFNQLQRLNVTGQVHGVIGLGAIGNAVATYLANAGKTVWVYDKDPRKMETLPKHHNIYHADSIAQLVENSHIVGGFTGFDISQHYDFLTSTKPLILYSGSSEDKEFKTFLKQMFNTEIKIKVDPLSNLEFYTHNMKTITLLNGGFPLNFADRGPYSVPEKSIAVTRALIAWSDSQALLLNKAISSNSVGLSDINQVMVEPKAQQVIAQYAFTLFPELYSPEVYDTFSSLHKIIAASQGAYIPIEDL